MSTILDIAGATVIGGLVLLMIFNLNIHSDSVQYYSNTNLQLQQNSKAVAEMISWDLRKIGYKYNGTPFLIADSTHLKYYSDIDSNGTVDMVEYILGDTLEASATINPRDRYLYRIAAYDTSKGPTLGVVNLRFIYRNEYGNVTSILDSIKYIKTEIWFESLEPVNDSYEFTYWEMTINPRNL